MNQLKQLHHCTQCLNHEDSNEISNRVIAQKLEREEKKWKGEGEGWEKSINACPQTPRLWKMPLIRVICKLAAPQDRSQFNKQPDL